MKNILAILKELGIEVPQEKEADLNTQVAENYKTVADYDKQKEKLTTAESKVTTLTESLDKFKDVDMDSINSTITDLKSQLEQKDKDYESKIADRDFSDLLKNSILSAKGKDAEKISKLLNTDELKTSKNQKEDIEKAIKALAEDDVTKGMFGEVTPTVVGKGSIIGQVVNKPTETTGTLRDALRERYNK